MSSLTQERIVSLVLGDRGVGKTTLLEELCGPGPEWYEKHLVVDGMPCTLDICDNQGPSDATSPRNVLTLTAAHAR